MPHWNTYLLKLYSLNIIILLIIFFRNQLCRNSCRTSLFHCLSVLRISTECAHGKEQVVHPLHYRGLLYMLYGAVLPLSRMSLRDGQCCRLGIRHCGKWCCASYLRSAAPQAPYLLRLRPHICCASGPISAAPQTTWLHICCASDPLSAAPQTPYLLRLNLVLRFLWIIWVLRCAFWTMVLLIYVGAYLLEMAGHSFEGCVIGVSFRSLVAHNGLLCAFAEMCP